MNILQGTHFVFLCGAQAWTFSHADAAVLGVFERKVLRKIFGHIGVSDDYRIRSNQVLYELFNDVRINIQRLRWLGHVIRIDEDDLV